VVRIACDGAADRLLDMKRIPDRIIGDMDSISAHTLDVCRKHDVDIRYQSDQNSTDLEKAGSTCSESLVVLGEYAGFDGRLDHTFGIINYFAKCARNDVAACILGNASAMCVLPPGKHELPVPSDRVRCGIIPLEGRTRIQTRGLRWNLDGESQFSRIVSTSNMVSPGEESVDVICDNMCLWVCTT